VRLTNHRLKAAGIMGHVKSRALPQTTQVFVNLAVETNGAVLGANDPSGCHYAVYAIPLGRLGQGSVAPRPERSDMLFDRPGQKLRINSTFCVTSIVKLGFTSNTSYHHRLHEHKSRTVMANDIDQMPKIRTNPNQNVLIENEKRLDSSNLSAEVLQFKIQVFKLRMDCIVYQIVIAVIFVL